MSDPYVRNTPAGFFSRLLAFVIDIAIAVLLALGTIAVATLLQETFDRFVDTRVSLRTIAVIASPLILGGYFVLLWALAGRTIGKWVMGLRLVSAKGTNPTIGQSLVRVFGYLLSAIALYIGYLWVFVDKDRRAWHDHLARTFVVYDRSGGRGSLP